MRSRYVRAGLIAAAVIINVVVVIASYRARQALPSKMAKLLPAPSPQQKRVSNDIAMLAVRDSLATAWPLLDEEDSDGISIEVATARLGATWDSLVFKGVLGDRRIARIHGLLRELPRDVAGKECTRAAKERLLRLSAEWEKDKQFYESATSPVMSIPRRRSWLALAATVFLCLEYAEPGVTLGIIDEWRSTLGVAVREAGVDEVAYQQRFGVPLTDVFPDPLFEMNVYAIILDREQCVRLSELRSQLQLSVPPVMSVPLCRWDAKTAADAGEFIYPVFRGWADVRSSAQQAELVEAVRLMVRECLGK